MATSSDLDLATELRTIPPLARARADAQVLADLALAATQRRVHAGAVLVEQGSKDGELVFLLRGAIKVVRSIPSSTGESKVVLDVMRAPCLVLADGVATGGAEVTSLASIVALRASHVALLAQPEVQRLSNAHPAFARAQLEQLAMDVRSRVRRIDAIVAGPVDERVKNLLDGLALDHGTPVGQGRFIAIPLRRRDLAHMVNATTETVSRLLARFERDGQARSTRDGIWWRTARGAPDEVPPEAPRPREPLAVRENASPAEISGGMAPARPAS